MWSGRVLYTSNQLLNVHRHFYHPNPENLYAVMKLSEPEEVSPDVPSDLEKISATCDVCKREADSPHRFRVSIPGSDCVINRTVCLDLMSLDGDTVLHVVDKDKKFNTACFLSGESVADFWEAFIRIWVSPYIGYPDVISVDQGPQFKSLDWKNLLQAACIKEHTSGVESHNSLGVGERYHSFLCHVYNKFRADNATISRQYALQLAVKATNDTAGPSELVPTLLVFGILPRIPLLPKELPQNVNRIKSMYDARK